MFHFKERGISFTWTAWGRNKIHVLTYTSVRRNIHYFKKHLEWTGLNTSVSESTSGEAAGSTPTQEISRLFRKPDVHYRVHKSPPPDPILNRVQFTPCFFKMHFNSIIPSIYRYPTSSSPFLRSAKIRIEKS